MDRNIELSIIRKIADYVLLNAYSTRVSGLYNGKAGMSLALFEVSRTLQDEYYEEQAMGLLQEALLSQTDEIGYEEGLAGIGFTLTYLISQGFIDANFEELFGAQLIKIKSQMNQMLDEKGAQINVWKYIKITRLLDVICSTTLDNETKSILERMWDVVGEFLRKKMDDKNRQTALAILPMICTYFALLSESIHSPNNSSDVINKFYELQNDTSLAHNFLTNYYAGTLVEKLDCKKWGKTSTENERIAMRGLCVETLSFVQIIELLGVLNMQPDKYCKELNRIEQYLFNKLWDGKSLEHHIIQNIGVPGFIAGYKSGLSGYLVCWSLMKRRGCKTNLFI